MRSIIPAGTCDNKPNSGRGPLFLRIPVMVDELVDEVHYFGGYMLLLLPPGEKLDVSTIQGETHKKLGGVEYYTYDSMTPVFRMMAFVIQLAGRYKRHSKP